MKKKLSALFVCVAAILSMLLITTAFDERHTPVSEAGPYTKEILDYVKNENIERLTPFSGFRPYTKEDIDYGNNVHIERRTPVSGAGPLID